MAYVHKKTFDIVHDSNIDGFLDDYFVVDDLIAFPIQTLNRKGYTTIYCSGHPFPEMSEAIIKTDFETANAIIPEILSISEHEKGNCRVRYKQYLDRYSYISFDKYVPIPEHLPLGLHWKDHTMYRLLPGHHRAGVPGCGVSCALSGGGYSTYTKAQIIMRLSVRAKVVRNNRRCLMLRDFSLLVCICWVPFFVKEKNLLLQNNMLLALTIHSTISLI